MRANKRYLDVLGKREHVEKAILDYIGILGWAKAAPVFISTSEHTCVLGVNREKIVDVKAAISLSEHNLKVKRISGTLKGLSKHKT